MYVNQAKFYLDRNEVVEAEQCFINAKCPDMMVDEYLDRKMIDEALRMARKYVPSRISEINSKVGKGNVGGGKAPTGDKLKTAKVWEEQREWQRAI